MNLPGSRTRLLRVAQLAELALDLLAGGVRGVTAPGGRKSVRVRPRSIELAEALAQLREHAIELFRLLGSQVAPLARIVPQPVELEGNRRIPIEVDDQLFLGGSAAPRYWGST